MKIVKKSLLFVFCVTLLLSLCGNAFAVSTKSEEELACEAIEGIADCNISIIKGNDYYSEITSFFENGIYSEIIRTVFSDGHIIVTYESGEIYAVYDSNEIEFYHEVDPRLSSEMYSVPNYRNSISDYNNYIDTIYWSAFVSNLTAGAIAAALGVGLYFASSGALLAAGSSILSTLVAIAWIPNNNLYFTSHEYYYIDSNNGFDIWRYLFKTYTFDSAARTHCIEGPEYIYYDSYYPM